MKSLLFALLMQTAILAQPVVLNRSSAIVIDEREPGAVRKAANDLASDLEKSFDMPVYLEHSTRCAIMAERWLGLGQNVRNFVFVTVGYGVGVGIFSNGRFVGGRDQMAGELGHIRIDPAATDHCRTTRRLCLLSTTDRF